MDAATAAQVLGSCESGPGMAPQASRKDQPEVAGSMPLPRCGGAGGPNVQQCVIRVQ